MVHLGELEKLVLKYVWQVKITDAKQAHAFFVKRRGGSLNTIQSTLDRLFKKGLLEREKDGHAYQYSAAIQRKKFIGQLLREVTGEFSTGDEDNLITAFLSLSGELDGEQLDKLEEHIKNHRSKLNSDKKS